MKNFFYFGIVMSVLMLFACGKTKVEDVVKDHVRKQFNFDNAVKVDISKLKYTVTKKEALDVSPKKEPSDSVEIKETSPVAPKKIASHGEQKPESSHGEQEISHKQ